MKNRPLYPKFLSNIENSWLKKNPILWSSRILPVAYYGGFIFLLILAVNLLVNFDPFVKNDYFGSLSLIFIIGLICFVFWVVYLLRFNPFKRFNIYHPADFFKHWILYLIIITFFTSWILIPSTLSYLATVSRFTKEDLIKDSRVINLCMGNIIREEKPNYLITTEKMIHISKSDSLVIWNNSEAPSDTITYKEKVEQLKYQYDTLIQVNDTIFKGLIYPSLVFVDEFYYYLFDNSYAVSDVNFPASSRNKLIFNRLLNYSEPKSESIKKMNEFMEKYHFVDPYSYYYEVPMYSDGPNENYEVYQYYVSKYNTDKINTALNRIDRKLNYAKELEYYLRGIFYVAFGLSLLLLIFRHTSPKSFFLTILVGFIIFILNVVFFVVVRIEDSEVMLLLYLVYFIGFSIIGSSIFNSKVKSLIKIIALNLSVMMYTFLPFILAFLEYELFHKVQYNYTYTYTRPESLLLKYEIGTSLLFILLLFFFYNKLYKKWYSLPDE